MRFRFPLVLLAIALVAAGWVVLDAVLERTVSKTPAAEPAGVDGPDGSERETRFGARAASGFRSLRATGPAATASPSSPPLPGPTVDPAGRIAPARARRELSGAPPWIPHPVSAEMATGDLCLTCHRYGGWAPPFEAWAPPTPHPELSACQQCHVARTVERAWREEEGLARTPAEPVPAVSSSPPPPMPHELYEGLACLDCHGADAPDTIRTTHPERSDCARCHLPAAGTGSSGAGGEERR